MITVLVSKVTKCVEFGTKTVIMNGSAALT